MKKNNLILILVLLLLISIIIFGKMNKEMTKKDGFQKAPELAGISGYFNTNDLKISDLKGKVVLIDFWTYSCINCIRTLPHLVEWDKKYNDMGLVIIGVHTPEFDFEKRKENVAMAIEKYGIEYIVVQDNDYATWNNYNNRYWPHKFLIDKNGNVVYDHVGEGAYEETEMEIQKLLGEDLEISDLEDKTPRIKTTPELYAEYKFALPRGQLIGNGFSELNAEMEYNLPDEIKDDIIYLEGAWFNGVDSLEARSDGVIVLRFTAYDVNIVADSLDKSEMKVFINGEPRLGGEDVNEKSIVLVNEPRLYNVVKDEYGTYVLRLEVKEGFSFNAFTFG